MQRWAARLGGLTTFAEAAGLLDDLLGVAVGTETLRTHAEQIGTDREGQQQALQAHVRSKRTCRGSRLHHPRSTRPSETSW